MLELYQAEWCPHSRKVRRRLTELGVDFVARQVPTEPGERRAMRDATGEVSIPTLVLDGGRVVSGEDEILRWLDEAFEEPAEADAHRAKAIEEGLPE
jgi:glutathione S-transferase